MKAAELFASLAVKEELYFLFVIPFNDRERGFACLVVVLEDTVAQWPSFSKLY